jgi:hypothetical protein
VRPWQSQTADGINRADFWLLKNARIRVGHTFQIHANFFNTTNSRDWSIPDCNFTSPAFLNEGMAPAQERRVQLGLRVLTGDTCPYFLRRRK